MDLLHPKSNPLDLQNIRNVLIRLEESIIFALIERAQFARNPKIYEKGAFKQYLGQGDASFNGSWLDWMLKETEKIHAKVRRYTSPDEHPFTPSSELPEPLFPPLEYPSLLHPPSNVNVNARILDFYIHSIVPAMTRMTTEAVRARGGIDNPDFGPESDGNYGSSATRDIEALQAISRRIHYGMFVSESKFRSDPAAFVPHILEPDPDKLAGLITKPAVEEALLRRLEKKALMYGQELDGAGNPLPAAGHAKTKVDVDEVVKLYRDWIIPLTKDVEVEYLLKRLDNLSPADRARYLPDQNGTV
ncbi:uncharacterized protein L969DRAFT_105113 [Mixia osmundae IAM 14324]|nr:uncharacterized protein L969DRAFT_105113 [Mixia osmundae IAM 14324]KEI37315.1 hypothetical protein L969DRAFT_105113 [Mixia osmundae IAM 14324]